MAIYAAIGHLSYLVGCSQGYIRFLPGEMMSQCYGVELKLNYEGVW